MRVVTLSLALLALAGCASTATVGVIDLEADLEPIRQRSLLVVPLASDFGGENSTVARFFRQGGPDTVRVQEFVPLDSLGAPSYRAYAVGAIAEALREDGAWASVAVGPVPDSLALVEERYSVREYSAPRSRVVTRRRPIEAPAFGTAGAFGDVDYALLVRDAGVAFVNGDTGPYGSSDDAVVLRADLVVWDNRSGEVVTFGPVGGRAPIKGRLSSSADERTPSALIGVARDGLAEALAEAFPALLGRAE